MSAAHAVLPFTRPLRRPVRYHRADTGALVTPCDLCGLELIGPVDTVAHYSTARGRERCQAALQ